MDDDDWTYNYPQLVVSWIANLMKGFDYKYDPLTILNTERVYPGLWDDLLTEMWYRELLREQIEGSKKK